jgi:hypothetical protein
MILTGNMRTNCTVFVGFRWSPVPVLDLATGSTGLIALSRWRHRFERRWDCSWSELQHRPYWEVLSRLRGFGPPIGALFEPTWVRLRVARTRGSWTPNREEPIWLS